jgi:hypothetical protein
MSTLKRKLEGQDDIQPSKVLKNEDEKTSDALDDTRETAEGNIAMDEELDKEDFEDDEGEVEDEDEEDDEEDEGEDEDRYEVDDFIVEEEPAENDESETEEKVVKSSKMHKKLKKTGKKFMLDEDDQLLIQESTYNRGATNPNNQSNNDVIEEEIVPNDADDESDVNDFIEDEGIDRQTPILKHRTAKNPRFTSDGPTYDQVQEARDIFGDGYDEIGEEETFFDESEDLVNQISSGSKGRRENQGLGFEYIQLVQNFCLDEDEVIREADVPERFQIYHKSRPKLSPEIVEEESLWIVNQLRVSSALDFSERSVPDLQDSVKKILNFLTVRILTCLFCLYYFITDIGG